MQSRARRVAASYLVTLAALGGLSSGASAAWRPVVGDRTDILSATTFRPPVFQLSIAAIGDVPYVAFSAGYPAQIQVRRLRRDRTGWEDVDPFPPINFSDAAHADEPSLAAVDGSLHVAWAEGGSIRDVRVSWLGGTYPSEDWRRLGGRLDHDPARDARSPSLAAIGGIPYVAWQEHDGTNTEIRVSRLNSSGTGWEEVVGGASPINHDSARAASNPSLIGIQGVPYVAWQEFDGAYTQIRVSRLNAAGTAWEQVVGGTSPINHDASSSAAEPSLASIGNVPHVAWTEDFRVIRVSRLNAAGTAWEPVGGVAGAVPVNEGEAPRGHSPQLLAVGDVAHVVWLEVDGANHEVRVSRLAAAGEAWKEVVGGASPINADPDRHAYLPVITSIDGVLYVAWRESTAEDDPSGARVHMKMCAQPRLLAGEALPGDSGAILLQAVDNGGYPYSFGFAYGAGALTSHTPFATGVGDAAFQRIDGLVPATDYRWRAAATDDCTNPVVAANTSPERTFRTLARSGSGPQGLAGPAGPQGPPGPAGPAGSRGEPAFKLLVASIADRMTARRGARVTVRYLSTASATTRLEVRRGDSRVAVATARAAMGRNTVSWNGKIGRAAARPGKYTLRLIAAGADGQSATDQLELRIRKGAARR